MHIFEQEKLDGIAEKIIASASVSYASVAEPCSATSSLRRIKSLASIDDSDLYYVQSILVSSSWNKNDDIFDKEEIWAARNTPEDKPTNLEHDESTIIGHITSNWPITVDGILIDENTDVANLPDKYHILTGSVIYKAFSSPELQARASQLIQEIEDGEKFVSMECFFKNFDYGLIDQSTGTYTVLPRNEATAHLTKHLRAYGGTGEHQNFKIGRVLKNITFSGKGFVNRPANPDSIIFSKNLISENQTQASKRKNDNFAISGVFNNQSNLNVENYTMSLDKETTDQPEVVVNEVAPMQEAQALLVAELQDKIVALEATIQSKDTEVLTLKASYDELVSLTEASKTASAEEIQKIKSELEAALEVLAAYKNKEEEMMKQEKKNKRMASLIEAGVDSAVALTTLDKFDSLDDNAFEALTSLFAAKKTNKEEEEMPKKEKASNEMIDTDSLEKVEIENDINLGVAGDAEAEVQTTRAALVEFVCHRLGKNINKGE